jgi:hypothetical protein
MKNGNCSKCSMMIGALLVVGGLVHLVPQLYAWLTNLTGGTPYVQMVVGLVSVVMGLVGCVKGGCPHCEMPEKKM